MNWFLYVFLNSIALLFYYFDSIFYIAPARKRMPRMQSNKDCKILEKVVTFKGFKTYAMFKNLKHTIGTGKRFMQLIVSKIKITKPQPVWKFRKVQNSFSRFIAKINYFLSNHLKTIVNSKTCLKI